jgi:hypothetical protein
MPHAKILTKQALYTLSQLHSELAGKPSANRREAKRLRLAIFQVEAVMKMLSPDMNLRLIASQRRQSVVQARDARKGHHRHAAEG